MTDKNIRRSWPSGKAIPITAYDLVAPTATFIPSGSSTCLVCGKPTEGFMPLKVAIGRTFSIPNDQQHYACREQYMEWMKTLELVNSKPEVTAAQNIADAYQEAADTVWASVVAAQDVPEWVKEQFLAANSPKGG